MLKGEKVKHKEVNMKSKQGTQERVENGEESWVFEEVDLEETW